MREVNNKPHEELCIFRVFPSLLFYFWLFFPQNFVTKHQPDHNFTRNLHDRGILARFRSFSHRLAPGPSVWLPIVLQNVNNRHIWFFSNVPLLHYTVYTVTCTYWQSYWGKLQGMFSLRQRWYWYRKWTIQSIAQAVNMHPVCRQKWQMAQFVVENLYSCTFVAFYLPSLMHLNLTQAHAQSNFPVQFVLRL